MTYDLFQNVVIFVVVALAAVMMARRLFPATMRRVGGAVGLKPKALNASGGCDSGCASCSGCKTVKFDLPPKS